MRCCKHVTRISVMRHANILLDKELQGEVSLSFPSVGDKIILK
jgi:hypothetical protein